MLDVIDTYLKNHMKNLYTSFKRLNKIQFLHDAKVYMHAHSEHK